MFGRIFISRIDERQKNCPPCFVDYFFLNIVTFSLAMSDQNLSQVVKTAFPQKSTYRKTNIKILRRRYFSNRIEF